MHIAFLTPEYPHSELSRSGGLGTSIKNLAKGLVQNGVKVSIFIIGQSKNIHLDDDGNNTSLLIGIWSENEFKKQLIITLKLMAFN